MAVALFVAPARKSSASKKAPDLPQWDEGFAPSRRHPRAPAFPFVRDEENGFELLFGMLLLIPLDEGCTRLRTEHHARRCQRIGSRRRERSNRSTEQAVLNRIAR